MIAIISHVLNISLDPECYEERVQKRYDYIQEQLEKDPEFVGYDYLEFCDGRVETLWQLSQVLIDTKGNLCKLKNDNWVKTTTNSGKYKVKQFTIHKNNYKNFLVHRAVASTFIPKYKHLIEIPHYKLEVNHKDGDKMNNDISNLEWSTTKENIHHAIELGLIKFGINNDSHSLFLATIVAEGPYKDQQFVIIGNDAFRKAGIMRGNVTRCIKGERKVASGCTWEVISKDRINEFPFGPPKGFVKSFRENPLLTNTRLKPILVTIVNGVNMGYRFCLLGVKDLSNHGFEQRTKIANACKTKTVYKGCLWEEISYVESLNYPRGCCREILDSIFM